MSAPNIIFVVLDTLRADRLLGNTCNINLMPFLRSLLNKSLHFKNCIANTTWTLPSHISMFTGLYSTQNLLISKKADALNNKSPVLTEILKDLGYFTMCYSENPFISKTYGLTRGFDKIVNSWKFGGKWWWWVDKKDKFSRISKLLDKINTRLNRLVKKKIILKIWDNLRFRIDRSIKNIQRILFWENLLISYKNNTLKNLEKFNHIIQKNLHAKPYYLFYNIMASHDPYLPLKRIIDLFGIKTKDFKSIREFLLNVFKYSIKINMKSKHLSKKKSRILKLLYDASTFYCDSIIKQIFTHLEQNQLLDNSYVIITSDHGEHLFDKEDHFLWGHETCLSVYNAVINVPLIILGPNIEKRTINPQVQLKDLFHTILHMTGIPESINKYLVPEFSILQQIERNQTPKFIFGEYNKSNTNMIKTFRDHMKSFKQKLIPKIFNNLYFLRSNSHKYIKYNKINAEEFYDIEKDPYEQNNIFNDAEEHCIEMKMFMENLLSKIKDPEMLKNIITEKEKDNIKKSINISKIDLI